MVCLLNELFFVALYLLKWYPANNLVLIALYLSLPVCAFKQVVNVVQLVGASQNLAKADVESRRKGKQKAN